MRCDWYCGSALIWASVNGSERSFFSENAWVWSLAYFDAGLLDRENVSTPWACGPWSSKVNDLQVAAAADYFALAIGTGHGLHGVVDPQFLRAAVDRGLAGDLDITPFTTGLEAELGDVCGRGLHGFAQGLGDRCTVDGQAARCGQGLGRVEGNAPGIRDLLQLLHQVDEVHQTQAAVEVGVPVPVFEAGAQRLQCRRIGARGVWRRTPANPA